MGRFWPNRLLFWNVLLKSFFFPFAWVGFLHLTPTVNVHAINITVLSQENGGWRERFSLSVRRQKKTTKQKKKVSFGWKAKYIWSFWKEMLLKGFFVELLPFIFFSAGGASPQCPASNILLHKDALESSEIFTFSSVSEFAASRAHRFLGADCLWICVFFGAGPQRFWSKPPKTLLVFGRPVA